MIAGTEPAPSPKNPRLDLAVSAVLVAASAALRLPHLSRPLLGDEMISFSNMVLGRSFMEIVLGPFDSNNHVLNSVIMKLGYLGFGEAPALMRLPNLLMVSAAVVVLYLFGSRILGRPAGFAAALLFGLHPAMVLFSVSCRGYAGMVLFTLLSSVLLLRLLQRFSWPCWIACAAAGAVAAGFHLFAVNVLVAQFVTALLAIIRPPTDARAAAGRPATTALAPLAALALAVAGSLPILLAAGARFGFQPSFPAALVSFLGDHRYDTGLDVVSIAVLALAVVGWFGLRDHGSLRRLVGLLALSPVALYGLSFIAPVFTLHPRFFCYLLPFVFLMFAAGIALIVGRVAPGADTRPMRRLAASTAAVVCVALIAAAFVDRIRVPRKDPWADARVAVRAFIDAHPGALFPTNDPGFVRVRLRQQPNMHRIPTTLGVKAIRTTLVEHPASPVYFIYVRQKRFTESDLIHYKGDVPPEVLYRRDGWLRGFLDRNAALELDVPPRVRIYRLRPEAPIPPADDSSPGRGQTGRSSR